MQSIAYLCFSKPPHQIWKLFYDQGPNDDFQMDVTELPTQQKWTSIFKLIAKALQSSDLRVIEQALWIVGNATAVDSHLCQILI
jgi:hypothetical protein